MPELPEVETVRIGLQALLPGRTIVHVEHDTAKSFPNAEADVRQFLVGASIVAVARRAKVLLIELDSKYSLVIHLKMTGQLVFIANKRSSDTSAEQNVGAKQSNGLSRTDGTAEGVAEASSQQAASNQTNQATWSVGLSGDEGRWGAGHPSDSLVGELPDKSTRVTLTFDDGSRLFFNDQRKFGWMRLMPTAEVVNLDFFKKVGPEPLGADFNAKILQERAMRRKNSNIKAVLLDQTVLAGIGNIYADESLWGAKIHPETLVRNLSSKQFAVLYDELVKVLKMAIEKGGSTDRNYVSAEGRRGSYLSFARVFRREGQACPRCGTVIIKTRVAGRGTHICPNCQRLLNK